MEHYARDMNHLNVRVIADLNGKKCQRISLVDINRNSQLSISSINLWQLMTASRLIALSMKDING